VIAVDELIRQEVQLYVACCEQAARHDSLELFHKALAHSLFLHIQALRQSQDTSYTDFYMCK
jgi:hypothetical protein